MAKKEILEILRYERIKGNNNFFSVPEITEKVKKHPYYSCNPRNVWLSVVKLEADDYLDIKREGKWRDWRRTVRLKNKYV